MRGSHNPFPKDVEGRELWPEERLKPIKGMSMMKGKTQWVVIKKMNEES